MKNRIKQKKAVSQKAFAWIGLQFLEPRLTLAGDGISAAVHGGTLMIKGSKAADSVIILDDSGLDEGEIRISTGDSGIPINHHSGDVVLSGITRDIKVVLGKGNDSITFNDISAPNGVSVVGGPGNDTVIFNGGEAARDVKLVTGPGNETITLDGLSVGRDLTTVTGPDGASISMIDVEVGRKTNVQNGPADDTLTIDDSLFHGSVRVHTGTGSDTVLIETQGDTLATTVFEGTLSVSLDNGDDHMRVGVAGEVGHSVLLDAKTIFDGGPGFDTLSNPEANGASDSSHLTVVNFEAFAPFVVSTSPAANATGVSVGTTITATFDVAMDPDTINASTFLVSDTGGPIAGTVTYSGFTAVFTPSAPLSAGTVYTVRITTGVKDLSGVAMLADFVWTFTTA